MKKKSPSYLDTIDDAFHALAKADPTLGIDGTTTHCDLPQRFIPAIELRSVLLHPSVSYAARDAAWAELIARIDGSDAATLVVLGVLIPGLKRAGGQLVRRTPDGIGDDIDAELVTGALEGLAAGVGSTRIASKLLTHAVRRARRLVANQRRFNQARDGIHVDSWDTSSPEAALDLAVQDGTITEAEAELIAVTRIEGRSTDSLAEELGISVETLRTRRNRAERKFCRFVEENR